MSYRLVTPNTEPNGVSTEYDSLDDSKLRQAAVDLIGVGHKYVRVIEWPPTEVVQWNNEGKTIYNYFAEWVNWAWYEGLASGHAYDAYKESGYSYEWLLSAKKFNPKKELNYERRR